MRIAMMGSGAIGGYLGARLALAGEDVVFIARGAHLEAMRADGLRLESPLGDLNLAVQATDTPSDIGVADVVIVAVKLYDVEAAAAAIVPIVGPQTRVVTFQNGIDSVDVLSRFVPRSQVIGGAAYISTYVARPGVIVHLGSVAQFKTGGREDATITALSIAAGKVGLDLQAVDDIAQVIWMKFVTLCAFSGGTALMRSGIGPILADPESRLFIEQLRDEGIAVAAAAGHPMTADYVERIHTLWHQFPPETKSSMANDLAHGKPLELRWLSGRMHSLGQSLGVPTPAHTAVYRALHLYADGALQAPPPSESSP